MDVQESAIQHYRGFIKVASCLRTLKTEVSAIGEHLDALTDDLTVLDEACHSFSTGAREHQAKRAQNQQLLSRLLLCAVTSLVSVYRRYRTCMKNFEALWHFNHRKTALDARNAVKCQGSRVASEACMDCHLQSSMRCCWRFWRSHPSWTPASGMAASTTLWTCEHLSPRPRCFIRICRYISPLACAHVSSWTQQAMQATTEIQAPSCFMRALADDLTLECRLTASACVAPWLGGPKPGERD